MTTEEHICVNCKTIYAEYVNGCPKCWDKYGKSYKVVPICQNCGGRGNTDSLDGAYECNQCGGDGHLYTKIVK